MWEESTCLRGILWVFRHDLCHWTPINVVHTGALSSAQLERKEGERGGGRGGTLSEWSVLSAFSLT